MRSMNNQASPEHLSKTAPLAPPPAMILSDARLSLRRNSCAAGFSLIELLVFVLIVTVLLAIAYPLYQTGRDTAKGAGCVANLRQIGVGLIGYAADHRQYLPPTARSYQPPFEGRYDRLFWPALVAPYMNLSIREQPGQRTMRCPSRKPFDPDNGENFTYGITLGKAAHTDEVVDGAHIPGSYYTSGYVKPLPELGRGTFIVADCDGESRPTVFWPGSKGSWRLNVDRGGTSIPDSSGALQKPFNEIRFIHRQDRANFLRADCSIVSMTRRKWAENQDNIWGDFGIR